MSPFAPAARHRRRRPCPTQAVAAGHLPAADAPTYWSLEGEWLGAWTDR